MKTNNNFKRYANILKKAVEHGYDASLEFGEYSNIEEVIIGCEEHLIDNEIDVKEVEIDPVSVGRAGQHLSYSDDDYCYECTGEIIDWAALRPREKYVHTWLVDNNANVIALYSVGAEKE